ncbi:cobalamin biosynthesis protein CbiN [Sporosarcina globispora]|uniref:Cobalt transport protein CbiN n=1 Tax=Sporosarcina globispora TaxID=1459 RepID=A0A0M0GJM8_SPOGL|nr:energy-coupling factor ABC transporter substrate-binding protein [Sporosarcina globispora]KON90054.1 cobalamin biosynthesis protein CbiN [Sporosarcina globispora]
MKNVVLLLFVILLAIIPLIIQKDAEFGGADGQAEEVIGEVAPAYKPWFNAIWEPPSGEIESLLFSLQAALGASVIGYVIGYGKARKKYSSTKQ